MRIREITAAIAASLCLMISLAGCQERQPAEQPPASSVPVSVPEPTEPPIPTVDELMEAIKKNNAGIDKAVEADMALKYSIEALGVVQTTQFNMKIAGIGRPDEDTVPLECMADYKLKMLGQEVPGSFYLVGTDLYILSDGQKIKTTLEETAGNISIGMLEESDEWEKLKNLVDWDSLKPTDAQVEKRDDGYTLSCSVSGDKIVEMLKKVIEAVCHDEEDKAEAISEIDEHLGALDITLSLDTDAQGRLESGDLYFGITFLTDMPDVNDPEKVVETEVKLSADLSINIAKIGDEVTITPPADLDTYMTEEELAGIFQGIAGL